MFKIFKGVNSVVAQGIRASVRKRDTEPDGARQNCFLDTNMTWVLLDAIEGYGLGEDQV